MSCGGGAAHMGTVRRAARYERFAAPGVRGKAPMNGEYVGYVAGEDPLYGFLREIMRDRLGVGEPCLAFRVFRLSGSNEVYADEDKSSGAKAMCKFSGTKFGTDLDTAAGTARPDAGSTGTRRRS